MKLSATQAALVTRLREAGDSVIEYRTGGFWTAPGVAENERGVPEWYVATGTVKALLKAGVLVEASRHPKHGFVNQARLADAS